VSGHKRTSLWSSPWRRALRRGAASAGAYARGYAPGRAGSLPGAVIIGAQRSGTTALWDFLCEHPDVRPGLHKEIQYFSNHPRRSLQWYRGNFPRLEPGQLTLDATPIYLFDPAVPPRLAAALPDAKVIAILRDPVDRAYSQWQHSTWLGEESLPFAEALAAEPFRLANADSGSRRRAQRIRRSFSYVARGQYAEQLVRWREQVGPDRLLVLRLEDMSNRGDEVYQEILTFLGLRPHSLPDYPKKSRRAKQSVDQRTEEIRRQLRAKFADDDARLRTLVPWEGTWSD